MRSVTYPLGTKGLSKPAHGTFPGRVSASRVAGGVRLGIGRQVLAEIGHPAARSGLGDAGGDDLRVPEVRVRIGEVGLSEQETQRTCPTLARRGRLRRTGSLGPQRYTDLRKGLPAIPPNILSARVEQLKESGLATCRALPHPERAVVYELTDYGRDLEAALIALGHWAPVP